MTTNKTPDIELIKRIIDELVRCNMDPKELVHQLALNVTLEDRTKQLNYHITALERTINQRDQRLKQLAEEDSKTQKAHEELLAKNKSEITEHEKASARLNDKILQLNDAKARIENEIAIGKWLIALIARTPEALQLLELVTSLVKKDPSPHPNWTEDLAYAFLTLARKALTDLGYLVPKKALDEAKRAADTAERRSKTDRSMLNRHLDAIVNFTKNPKRLTTEQKRVLLETFIQTGAQTQEGFQQLMKQIESSETCPIHNRPMAFHYQQRQWICPVLGCSSRH